MFLKTDFVDNVDIWQRTSVAYRRLHIVKFNDKVVNAHAVKSGKNMFNRMHTDIAYAQSGSASNLNHVSHVCRNFRTAFHVRSDKADSRIGRRRFKCHSCS